MTLRLRDYQRAAECAERIRAALDDAPSPAGRDVLTVQFPAAGWAALLGYVDELVTRVDYYAQAARTDWRPSSWPG